jgi:hypothetical protein
LLSSGAGLGLTILPLPPFLVLPSLLPAFVSPYGV